MIESAMNEKSKIQKRLVNYLMRFHH